MVGEVCLTRDVQAGNRALQVVVHPDPAHGVVDCRVDPHGNLVWILTGDLLIHVEEVAVLIRHPLLAQAVDGIGEIEVDATPDLPGRAVRLLLSHRGTHTAALIAHVLGLAGGDITRH